MKLAIIGFISGIISGMGIGGGTILIPSLVLFADISQIKAQGVNLIVFIPVSLVAIITHKKQGNIEFKYSKKVGLAGLISAVLGAYLASKIDPSLLRKAFGIFLLPIGLLELFSKKE